MNNIINNNIINNNIINNVMTLSEAAQIWNLAEGTIRWALKSGKLTPNVDYRKAGRITLISKEAMKKLYGEPTL